jgi:hypothetical protein
MEHRTLTPLVLVRIQVPQPRISKAFNALRRVAKPDIPERTENFDAQKSAQPRSLAVPLPHREVAL